VVDDFEIIDSSRLTDADWAKINELRKAHKNGCETALSKALGELMESDPIRCSRIIGAFFPDMMREAIKDQMAEVGMTEEDLREMVRKLESPVRDQ
jgi:hypothetical protein